MADEYSKIAGRNVPGVFTAKPPELWGNPVREYSTGLGVAVIAVYAAKALWGSSDGKTAAIQGFGNVGRWTAYWLEKMGVKVVAVSDVNGRGPDLLSQVAKYNDASIAQDPGAVFGIDADILVPAALENAITEDNVKLVRAKLVVEGANGPTTPEAEKALYERGVVVVPDVLANAGGVVMSYLEWVENLQWVMWDEEETRARLEKIMADNFKRVHQRWVQEKGWTVRDAAYVIAVERIYRAMKARGWI